MCPASLGAAEKERRSGLAGSMGLDLRVFNIEFSSIKLLRQVGEGSFGRWACAERCVFAAPGLAKIRCETALLLHFLG